MINQKKYDQLELELGELKKQFDLGKIKEVVYLSKSKIIEKEMNQIEYKDCERTLLTIEKDLMECQRDLKWFHKNGLILIAKNGKKMGKTLDSIIRSHTSMINLLKRQKIKTLSEMKKLSKNL